MDVKLETLYQNAVQLTSTLLLDNFDVERVANAMQSKDSTIERIMEFLRDFPSLAESQLFSLKELSVMLAESCLEMGSLLYSCGAPKNVWTQWTLLSGLLFKLGTEYANAIEMLTISGVAPTHDTLSTLATVSLPSYRDQAVQYVVFRLHGIKPPRSESAFPPDSYYETIIQVLGNNDLPALVNAIKGIVYYWLTESPFGKYEPGIFPVFEPEINAVVSALIKQGFELHFVDQKVRDFLQISLE